MTRLLFVTLLCFISGRAFGQAGASVEVHILPPKGEYLHTTTVFLWPLNLSERTDSRGRIVWDGLPEGYYRLEVVSDKYSVQDTGFYLHAGEFRLVVFHMKHPAAILPEVVVETADQGMLCHTFHKKDIQASRARDLPDFLSHKIGLDIRSDGTIGSPQTARIGGSQANQVLVLLDGRRLQNVGTGEADLSSMPLEWIESIQVYRGGQAALGGEAIGGILSITTRQESGRKESAAEVEVHPSYGRAGFLRAGSTGRVFSLVSFSRTQGSGDYRYRISEDDGTGEFTVNLGKTYNRQNAGMVRDQLITKFRSRWSEYTSLEAGVFLDRAARGMPGYLAPQLTLAARQKNSQEAVNVRAMHARTSMSLSNRFSYQHDVRDYSNPDPMSLTQDSHEDCRQWEMESNGVVRFSQLSASTGIRFSREKLTNTQIRDGEASRNRLGVWADAGWNVLTPETDEFGVTLNPGLRWERFETADRLLPSAGASFTHSRVPSLRGEISWGQSYRAPTLYSLFWMDDQSAQGNPDLLPETSSLWTARLISQLPTADSYCEAAVSDQWIENLIFWRRTFDNRWKPFNLKRAYVQTLDISVEQSLFSDLVRMGVGASWTEARDATGDRNTGGKYLTYRAPRTQRASIMFRYSQWEVSGRMRWISARPALETNSKWLSGYRMADVHLSYTIRVGRVQIEPMFGVDNLLNENYRIVRFAPMPLREWYASLSVTDW
ncbi:TonB-dependent receptor [candidate division KSB1 bacterium]|nr:MAG: TonB-dependent receptor [candidate division KSB1 bacterium]